MLKTPLCDLLGIEVPIICAPFGPWHQVDLAAALAMGAQAVNIGTRFVPSREFACSDDWKTMIVDAGAEDAVQTDALEPIMPPTPWPRRGRARSACCARRSWHDGTAAPTNWPTALANSTPK